ncbi:MAG: DUF1820 family protein [Granulosicoccaceae bacterium]
MSNEILYRVRFVNNDKVFEVYARSVYQGDLYGFVVIEELVFDTNTTVVVDPSEEKLKTEFEGVKQTIIPMHSIVRIDVVEKRGKAAIVDLKNNVTHLQSPIYTPGGQDS